LVEFLLRLRNRCSFLRRCPGFRASPPRPPFSPLLSFPSTG